MDPANQDAPRFTASSVVRVERNGRKYFRGATAASPVSAAVAEKIAHALAQSRAELAAGGGPRPPKGSYPYPERVLNEPLIDRVVLPGNAGAAAPRELGKITRNRQGTAVLNAYEVMFVDVDTVRETGAAAGTTIVDPTTALAELRALCARRADLCFRVYATKAGLRYLCTSRLFDPVSEASRDILTALKADPRFVTLCRVQKCYRARLSPKTWRCVVTQKPAGFLARLRALAAPPKTDPAAFATCRYLETVGTPAPVVPELEMIVELHDQLTESASGKPLA